MERRVSVIEAMTDEVVQHGAGDPQSSRRARCRGPRSKTSSPPGSPRKNLAPPIVVIACTRTSSRPSSVAIARAAVASWSPSSSRPASCWYRADSREHAGGGPRRAGTLDEPLRRFEVVRRRRPGGPGTRRSGRATLQSPRRARDHPRREARRGLPRAQRSVARRPPRAARARKRRASAGRSGSSGGQSASASS